MEKPIADISPVVDYALAYNPMLATRDISTIFAWINYGCSIEQDIIATMKEVIKRRPPGKSKINSFSYFTNSICESYAKRTMVADMIKEKPQAERDAIRAKNLQWIRDRNLYLTRVGAQDYEWLDQYNAKCGKI